MHSSRYSKPLLLTAVLAIFIPNAQAELSARIYPYIQFGLEAKKLEITNQYDNLQIKEVLVNRGNCYSTAKRREEAIQTYNLAKNNSAYKNQDPLEVEAAKLSVAMAIGVSRDDSLETYLHNMVGYISKPLGFGESVQIDLGLKCASVLEVTVKSNQGTDVLHFRR